MTIGETIRSRRKALGLTQEQVASCLNISTPAVSKWEQGVTMPDISLLPALARLLKTDLNALFDYRPTMSKEAISALCRRISAAGDLSAAFDLAEEHLRQYPHDDQLLHCLTTQLDGLTLMSACPDRAPYEARTAAWYEQLLSSGSEAIRTSAQSMLACRALRTGAYEKAQAYLDLMPDHPQLADKPFLQASLYLHREQPDRAATLLAQQLMLSANRTQTLLLKLMEAELAAGNDGTAEAIAGIASQHAGLLEQHPSGKWTAALQLAMTRQDANAALAALPKVLNTMAHPWDTTDSPLYGRIGRKQYDPAMLQAALKEIRRDPGCLAGRQELHQLMERVSQSMHHKTDPT